MGSVARAMVLGDVPSLMGHQPMIGRGPTTDNGENVGEFVTDGTLAALDADLAARGIDAGQIIGIFAVSGQPAGNDAPARYRVLYRQP